MARTILEAAHALGLPAPVTEADLRVLAHACESHELPTNLDGDSASWDAFRAEVRR